MDFAIGHKDWTVEAQKEVIFLDETKINRLSSDGRKCAWILPGDSLTDRLVKGTLKHGGDSVMAGGACLGLTLDIHAG